MSRNNVNSSDVQYITPISKVPIGQVFYVSPLSLGRYKTANWLYQLFLSDNQTASLITQWEFTIPCLCTSVKNTQDLLWRLFSSWKKSQTRRKYATHRSNVTNNLSIPEHAHNELWKEYFWSYTIVNVQDDPLIDATIQKKPFRRLRDRLYKKEKASEDAIRNLLHDFFNDVDITLNKSTIINQIDRIIIHLQSQTYNPERLYELLEQSITYKTDISPLVAPIMSKYRQYKANIISNPALLERIKEDSLDAREYELVAFVETKIAQHRQNS